MFTLEEDLISSFIIGYESRNKTAKISREVKSPTGWTDIVINKNSKKIAVEAKLKDIPGVIMQAINNINHYDESWILIPENKYNNLKSEVFTFLKKYKIKLYSLQGRKYSKRN